MDKKVALASVFRKIIRSIYGIINAAVIVWLLCCLYASFHDASTGPTLWSLFSFTNLFAVAANVVFVIVWLVTKRKKYALASLITLLISWNVTSTVFGIQALTAPSNSQDEQSLKVMSWNVHMFDLGEWTEDKTTFAKILKFIEDENPDILCMQEYYRDEKDYSSPYGALIRKMGYGYESFMVNNQWNKSKMTINASPGDVIDVGTVIYSKFPIKNKIYKKLPGKGQGMNTVEIELEDGKKIALTTLHLTSFQINESDIELIDSIKTVGVNVETGKAPSKNLLKKLMNASSMRAKVANEVAHQLEQIEYPNIVCGDFNDMPGSYVYSKIRGNLKDAFTAKGFGVGNTYQKILPILRIDYLFYDAKTFEAMSIKKSDIGLSDHYPIMVNLKIK